MPVKYYLIAGGCSGLSTVLKMDSPQLVRMASRMARMKVIRGGHKERTENTKDITLCAFSVCFVVNKIF